MNKTSAFRKILLGGVCVIAISVSAVSVTAAQGSVEGLHKYIVSVPASDKATLTAELGRLGVTATTILDQSTVEVSASLTEAQASEIPRDVNTATIAADKTISMASTSSPPGSWGLDALDQTSATLDGHAYSSTTNGGAGVDVYVLDTGLAHGTYTDPGSELYGRVDIADSANFASHDPSQPDNASAPTPGDAEPSAHETWECLYNDGVNPRNGGHGTHVAGTIGSTDYGVAPQATIIPIRVMNCLDETDSTTIVTAINYVINEKENVRHRPSVINMSLGGDCSGSCSSDPIVTAVNEATAAGITVVVAAGNGAQAQDGTFTGQLNACDQSPAAAPTAITVGAVGPGYTSGGVKSAYLNSWRRMAYFSNYGPCVSVFAPGEGITSLNAWHFPGGDTEPTIEMDGTSMASPHVAGVAALYLSNHPQATPAQVKAAIVTDSLNGDISGLTTTTPTANRLLNLSCLTSSRVSTPVKSLKLYSHATSSIKMTWALPELTCGTISDYKIQYKRFGSASWLTYRDGVKSSLNATLTGLRQTTKYYVRVAAITPRGMSSYATSALVATK